MALTTCIMYGHKPIMLSTQHVIMAIWMASSVGQWWWHVIVFSVHLHYVSDKSFVYQQKNQLSLEEGFAECLQVNCCYKKSQL